MKTVFADSYYYLAFVNVSDAGHERALEFSRSYRGKTMTTEWVLMEVADALSAPDQRSVFLELLEHLKSDTGLIVIESGHEMFERGVALFAERSDKSWSLTDCISFLVMNDHGLTESLTADHHFAQAGYVPLLK